MSFVDICEPLPLPLPCPAAAYAHIRPLIDATTRLFVRRHGGEYRMLRADADTSWWRGDQAYRNRATNGRSIHPDYRVEIRRWVWFELFDQFRVSSQARRANKVVIEPDEYIGSYATAPGVFNRVDFFDELSEDARTVVRLALDGPAELAALWEAKGGQPRNIRSTLREYLGANGWPAARISECFNEIAEALT